LTAQEIILSSDKVVFITKYANVVTFLCAWLSLSHVI